jgi:membrane fusion protein, multidrug efflux system
MKAAGGGTKQSLRRLAWIAGTGVALAAVSLPMVHHSGPPALAAPQHAAPQPAAVPVTVTTVARRDVPIFLQALGTVQASNTIAIRSQIDGKLTSVNFVEGQEVHAGDTLAVIDPRALQAALDEAKAKKAQDEAQLTGARKDLDRFKTLVAKNAETQQNVDSQQAKVDQLRATVDADEAAIESAKTQLSYATITAPIDGRVGFRQVDAGNIIHANDPNPLTVLTQIQPVVVTCTLPQKDLASIREAMQQGAVPALAYDQDNNKQLADGKLLLVDNQIDQTTSSIRLKAQFANNDDQLWPGEFVRLRLQVDTQANASTVPAVALQRGPQGLYVWVVKPDSTAEQRSVDAKQVDDQTAIVSKGLADDEKVVVDGQYRLQAGAHVDAKSDVAANTAGSRS